MVDGHSAICSVTKTHRLEIASHGEWLNSVENVETVDELPAYIYNNILL
jgi:hypothetical protein